MVHSRPSSLWVQMSHHVAYLFFLLFFSLSRIAKLRLGDVELLADHEASMSHKDQSSRVELEYRALGNDTEGNLTVDPTLANPVGDQGDNTEGCRCGKTFEVFGLAIGILGYTVGADVETSKTEKSAEGE
jgi:hypothetical protein